MRKVIRLWNTVVLSVAFVACGSQHEVRRPTSGTSADQGTLEGQDGTQPSAGVTSGPSDKSASQSLAEICEKLKRRAAQTCNNKVADLYRSSCNHYLKEPGPCEQQIRLALECQSRAADDVLCAHEADQNCSQVNRDLKVCQGTAPAEQNTAEDLTLPSGWKNVQDMQLGFTVAMPPGAAINDKSKRRTWQAEERGISYLVSELEPPSGKLNNRTYIRTVIAYVGNRCQLHLKLHGELELKGTTVVRYHSACPDGSEWHGMLHYWNGKAVSTGYHAPAGATGVQDPYFYSFVVAN